MGPNLRSFFLWAYALTWVFTIPFVLLWNTVLDRSFSPIVLLFLPAPFGPTIAALVLTHRQQGKAGVRALVRRLLVWRVPLVWYAFALFVPSIVVFVAIALSSYRGALAQLDLGPGLSIAPLAMVAALPFGPLAEELGWRGYAQLRLLETTGLWRSSLIVGVAWTFWHTPMFWFPGAAIPSFLEPSVGSVTLYLLQITAEACLMTFLFVKSGGSVLLAVLYHTTFNTAETIVFRMLPEPSPAQEMQVYAFSIAVSWVLAIGLLAWLSRTHER